MKYRFFLGIILGLVLTSGCKPAGCTDPDAKNFSYDAVKDDGSCNYGGCTDPNALNYNPKARENDGSCRYLGGVHFISKRSSLDQPNTFLDVKVNSEYIGKLQDPCNQPFPTCETNCDFLPFTEKESGSYLVQFWEIKQTGSNAFDTLFVSPVMGFQVVEKECTLVLIE